MITTEKDESRLAPLFGDDTPVWTLPERLVWKSGQDAVLNLVLGSVAEAASALR